MNLLRLALKNFRQHADTEIEFGPGLTGIIGPNGAGKSTILEAIAWAIYGASAARGTNDTLRFARAPGGSRVMVELIFEIAGHEYRVVRTLSNAEAFVDGGATPVASTIRGTTEFLERRLGMSREEFFNTYFTGQKELQFLAQMGPTERGRFLSQVLGYERLRLAQEAVRVRRNELRHEVDGLRTGLPDPDEIKADLEAAEARRADATEALAGAERELDSAGERRSELAPRWEEAQASRDRARELEHALDVATRDREAAERDAGRIDAELERIAKAAEELADLRERLQPLPGVIEECQRFARLAQQAERRRVLERNERSAREELEEARQRRKQLDQAPTLAEQFAKERDEAREAAAAAKEEAESLRSEWVERRQEVETKLQAYRDQYEELEHQIAQLREAGPEGTCPTCQRPLHEEFDTVLESLEEELEQRRQDGKWLKQRRKQLRETPEPLVEAERRLSELQDKVEEKGAKHARCERAVQELESLVAEIERREQRLAEVRRELEETPTGYDREQHQAAEKRLESLRELEHRKNRLDQVVEAEPERKRERAEADARIQAAGERIATARREIADLGFREEEFVELRASYEKAAEAVRRAELRVTELKGRVETAEQALETARKARDSFEERQAKLRELDVELRHHHELDGAFSELRGQLNDRVRPELSELASTFLTDITESRYTALEIDEDYNILVLDEGEEKPVISGGEEDIANLVLRLAISQMIAERAGHPLSTLILDEVFGSLDMERRDNVIQLLHRLGDRFEQVILITHVESIREGLDQVIRVDFDERSGSSVVVQEDVAEAIEAVASV